MARILVIEDDPEQLARLLGELRAFGYDALGAASAEDATAMLRGVPVDAIVADNVLPGICGMRAIAEFAKVSAAPVLIMTDQPSTEGAKDALLLGAKRYLAKPVDVSSLDEDFRALAKRS